MNGKFLRRWGNIWLILMLLCGLFFIALYIFLNIVDPLATGELLTFLIIGILICLVTVPSMLLNCGAYIRAEENRLQAKYHWFGRLDCSMEEVAFALPGINTLSILLKNGKRHIIMGVGNPWELAAYIRRHSLVLEKEAPEAIKTQLTEMQQARKKALFGVLGGILLMFANIFIAVLLTGGRDLQDFSDLDWTLFAVMGVVELLTVIVLFSVASRCGRYMLPMEHLKYRLRGAVIASHPLPENSLSVYTDENYTGRIVVCGFPGYESVYYCVQEFSPSGALETVYTSEACDNREALPEGGFEALLDITVRIKK